MTVAIHESTPGKVLNTFLQAFPSGTIAGFKLGAVLECLGLASESISLLLACLFKDPDGFIPVDEFVNAIYGDRATAEATTTAKIGLSPLAVAPEHDIAFAPACSCAAFREKGTCKHLLLPASGASATDASRPPALTDPEPERAKGMPQLPTLDIPPFEAELSFAEVLGRGASGATVFRCTAKLPNASTGIVCAAKVLPLSAATFPDMVEEFCKELDFAQQLPSHPSLVGFVGAKHVRPAPQGDAEAAYVLCIEYCSGTLDSIIRYRRSENRPFEPAELALILHQVVSGLVCLHEKRKMHRDLKATNIFFTEHASEETVAGPGTPIEKLCFKLGDYGLCKAASGASTPMVGTPQWMAPEIIRMEKYGMPADMWSLGGLIFELLELGPPYGEDITLPQLETALEAGQPPKLGGTESGADAEQRAPAFTTLMRACLDPDPAKRPTARAVLQRLTAIQQSSL
eukprot:TRINITY_DN18007_c0_g1_i1.p1 TRINITY_DN18007_c0_g1~~TRINITY_DN18007_c0_g1_i1.p1  ORF type:complete len:459 (+),score=79.70 TRINITY_DN18007_c0_g1_i1:177-1553(+)